MFPGLRGWQISVYAFSESCLIGDKKHINKIPRKSQDNPMKCLFMCFLHPIGKARTFLPRRTPQILGTRGKRSKIRIPCKRKRARLSTKTSKVAIGKRGLFENGVFSKWKRGLVKNVHCLEILENLEILEILVVPKSVQKRGGSGAFCEPKAPR